MSRDIEIKQEFFQALTRFVSLLDEHVSTDDGQWRIKGFIDVCRNIYTISSDTKIISKILEIHLFPRILSFAEETGYRVVLAEHQNYYPDISFVHEDNENVKFAVDFKTTYRLSDYPEFCNGFTLGSHGEYFINRRSSKNIQFPYGQYQGHFCLGIIYDRHTERIVDETRTYDFEELRSITSVIKDFEFFVAEKWKIASDKSGSGNTANIGSINKIGDIVSGRGMFSDLGEEWFDDYWMNYGKITFTEESGETKQIRNLKDFVAYRGGDVELIVPKARKIGRRSRN
ncbi:restriction endonuclease [Candidatus Poribacteria bacterium]|nr:restriction endonuclease [Candidatus Poribacteria bacterium]MYK94681.1 restriction endonuclease [Candidatus Poribacteria bacterium]